MPLGSPWHRTLWNSPSRMPLGSPWPPRVLDPPSAAPAGLLVAVFAPPPPPARDNSTGPPPPQRGAGATPAARGADRREISPLICERLLGAIARGSSAA